MSAPYIVRRGGSYSLRVRLPVDIAKILSRREFVMALRTRELSVAKQQGVRAHARVLDVWSRVRTMSGSDEDKRAVIDEALAAIRTFNLVREMALESHDQAMDELGQLVAVSHMAQGQAGVPPADHRDTLIRELMSRVEVLSKAVVDLERAATGKSLALQMLDDAQEKLVLEDQARAQRQHSMAMDVVRKEAEEAKSEVQSFRTRENAETLGVEAMSAFEKLMAQAGVITKSKQTPTVLDFLEGHYLQARNLGSGPIDMSVAI